MDFPEPVISMAIEPKSKADREKLSLALSSLSEEDPTFRVSTNEETGQTIICRDGRAPPRDSSRPDVPRILRTKPMSVNLKSPTKRRSRFLAKTKPSTSSSRVVAVNTPTSASKSSRMKKAKATKSSARSSAVSFRKNTSPPSSKGLKKVLQQAFSLAIRLVDVKVAIVYGSYHEVDSNEMAFKICGSMAVKEAARKCQPILLEPIMKVVVTTPEQFMGDVIGDINRRRGKIMNQTTVKRQSSTLNRKFPLAKCSATRRSCAR